ncbi:beta-phosphoglucomutase [Peribacillus acanthi]|uniref:beta-phosphoglucomutase n=1 Tax=Peribacillus acanthi TaxID=2171554 RepID=UPI000D3E137B|nr:beta-phosphoglucomutase [Peribacillus acanthi]
MSTSVKAVIFDLDGVIADTFEFYYITNKTVADKLGIPFTRKDNERYRGIGRYEIINSLVKLSKKELSEIEKFELAESKNEQYQHLIENMNETSILPGMKKFILDLKSHDIKIGLASSSTNGQTVLKKIGLYNYFDCIVNPKSLKKGKPDPEIFLKAAENLKVDIENCVAIEDGEAGIKAIKKTKMFSIGIGNGSELETADWHVLRTEEITYPELIKRFERKNYNGTK